MTHLESYDTWSISISDQEELDAYLEILPRYIDLREISISDCSITEIPLEIYELKNLKSIFIENAPITSIPNDILRLPHLEELYFDRCLFSEIPEILSRLPNLKDLHFSRCQIIEIAPEDFLPFHNLEVLSLVGNQLTNIPTTIQKLTRLRHFAIARNKFSTVPDSIRYMPNLEDTGLNGNPLSEFVFSEVYWPSLTSFSIDRDIPLYLDWCAPLSEHKPTPRPSYIEPLPPSLILAPHLAPVPPTFFSCSQHPNDPLHPLPKTFSKEMTKYLIHGEYNDLLQLLPRERYLEYALGSETPQDLAIRSPSPEKLDSVWCDEKIWNNLPKNGYLQRIDLSGLELSTLPEDFDKRFPFIQHLNLEHNQFTKLPTCLQNLPNLTGIWLQDNPLEEVDLDLFSWPNLRCFSVDPDVPLFVDTCCGGYKWEGTSNQDHRENRSPKNIFTAILCLNYSLECDSSEYPIREYPNILRKEFSNQTFARPIERYLPALLEGSIDPYYYGRFAKECSPSLRAYLREKLPSGHPLIALIDEDVLIPLNWDYDLAL